MNSIVQEKTGVLADICGRYHVKRLDLFGSAAATGAFNPDASDLDFLVEFESASPAEHCDRYFGLLGELEKLFNRHVDLVEAKAMKNPFFIRSVNASRALVYGS